MSVATLDAQDLVHTLCDLAGVEYNRTVRLEILPDASAPSKVSITAEYVEHGAAATRDAAGRLYRATVEKTVQV